MKTLIIIREADHRGVRELFPEIHPLLVPVCNKPAIEFLVDFSSIAGSTSIRIVGDSPLSDVQRLCESGTRWGVEISYANMQPGDTRDRVIEKNRRFCSGERVMVIDGPLFIRYDKRHDYRSYLASHPEGEVVSGLKGSILMTGEPSEAPGPQTAPPLSLPELDSTAQFFSLSREVLAGGADAYVLPGYNNEPDCHLGTNVVIQKGAAIIKPVMIGNNVQILAGAVIGPGSIIGNNVIIDRESRVEESLVFEGTYIGEHLEVRRRIASGSMLVEPESGSSLMMQDPHLISEIGQGSAGTLRKRLVHGAVAFMMIAVLLVPYLFMTVILAVEGRWKTTSGLFYSAKRGRTVTLTKMKLEAPGLFGRIAVALSLDRFILLFKVPAGQLALIGCRPLPVGAGQLLSPEWGIGYQPGVFSYAEAEEWPQNALDFHMVDRYHLAHGTVISDISMTLKALFNRNISIKEQS